MGRPRTLAGPALAGRAAARGGGAAAVGTRTPLVTPPRGRTAAGARRGPAGPRGTGLAGARAAMCVVVLRAASCHAADFTGAPARALLGNSSYRAPSSKCLSRLASDAAKSFTASTSEKPDKRVSQTRPEPGASIVLFFHMNAGSLFSFYCIF